MVKGRVRAGARDCTRCTFFFCSAISVVNTFVFIGWFGSQTLPVWAGRERGGKEGSGE